MRCTCHVGKLHATASTALEISRPKRAANSCAFCGSICSGGDTSTAVYLHGMHLYGCVPLLGVLRCRSRLVLHARACACCCCVCVLPVACVQPAAALLLHACTLLRRCCCMRAPWYGVVVACTCVRAWGELGGLYGMVGEVEALGLGEGGGR